MPVTLTIKQVPDKIAAGLRRRAEANRRSLQRELLLIVERAAAAGGAAAVVDCSAISEPGAPVYVRRSRDIGSEVPRSGRTPHERAGRMSLEELWRRARELGAPMQSESTGIIRHDRDARDRR